MLNGFFKMLVFALLQIQHLYFTRGSLSNWAVRRIKILALVIFLSPRASSRV